MKLKKALLLSMLALGAVGVASCEKKGDDSGDGDVVVTQRYTMTYDANGHGTAPSALENITSIPLTLPKLTANDGYTFEDWYLDAACTQKVTKGVLLTENITIYAKWVETTYKVTYNANGHGTAPAAEEKLKALPATLPTMESDSDFTFGGWYLDAACTQAATAGAAITANTTLYAKWNEVKYTITYNANGYGTAPAAVENVKALPAELPTLPSDNNFTFVGWYLDAECTQSAVAGATITANTTLYAKWKDFTGINIMSKAEIGTHTDKGKASLTDDNKIQLVGAGTKFDKDTGIDDFAYAFFKCKGSVTITAKIDTSVAGQSGIMLRNDAENAQSASITTYFDGSKNQFRYGRNGVKNGASGLGSITTPSAYIKIDYNAETGVINYAVADNAEFTNAGTKAETIEGFDIKTVGFFATSGVTAKFSDVNIEEKYVNDNNETITKVVYNSTIGELSTTHSTSADYSGKYASGNSFSTSADGNVLSVTQERDPDVKGNIREDVGYDYLLFDATDEDMTISADVTIKSINTGTDKQGFAMGQFVAEKGKATAVDVIHFQKNKVFQHSYSLQGTGNSGNPKSATLEDAIGNTYSIKYIKKANKVDFLVVAADGTVVIDSAKDGSTLDLTGATFFAGLQSGETVQYGFAFSGVSVDISNVTLTNSQGKVVYDMNDYYVAVGVSPVINNAVAEIAEDRESIDLTWDIETPGSGNVKYAIYVSKDGGEYEKIGDSKVASYSWSGVDVTGSYKFKIVPYGGETKGTEIETSSIDYVKPLDKTNLTVAVGADTESAVLTWTAVEGATGYDIYRKLGVYGTPEKIGTTTELTYTDSSAVKEEAYSYYIIAKNDTNTSNPCTSQRLVVSSGHTGTYVYEEQATTITVVSKDNDTIFANSSVLTLKASEAGTAKLNVNGSLIDTKTVSAADQEFTFNMTLVDGRNDVELLFEDSEGNITRKIYNFVVLKKYDAIVDSAYTGTDGAEVDGHKTYKTVQAAVNAVPSSNTSSYVIFIKNGDYNERITIASPYVSLIGEDAERTRLHHAVCTAQADGKSMWLRNAMYVDSTATGFTAENLTIENSYNYTNGSDQQADALCIVADQTSCINVRLIGYQDTLLTDTREKDESGNYKITRQYFEKCYITGNVDFIYGAGSSYFKDCDIVARYTSYKSDGCFTAARTYSTTPYGFVFDGCRFTTETGVGNDTFRLARPWGADASTIFINCYLGRCVQDNPYGDMSGNSAANARFAENGSYGPGYVVSNSRPYLSSSEANDATTKVVEGFNYETAINALYKSEE